MLDTKPRPVPKDTWRMVHLSKPLAYQSEVWDKDPMNPTGPGIFRGYRHFSVSETLPPGIGPVRLVVAPVVGKTYRRTEPKPHRPGRARRTRLTEERIARG